MRFSTILAALAAPLAVFAQSSSAATATAGTGASATGSGSGTASSATGINPPIVPSGGISATAGQTVQLNWTPTTSGTVSLYLRSGSSNNLIPGLAIASDIPNSGSYSWSVPSSVTRGSDYTVEIRSSQGSNYYPFFVIDSTNTVASVTNPSSSGTASSTGTASSSGTASSGATRTTSGTSGSSTGTSSTMGTTSSRTTGSSSSSASAGFQTTSSSSKAGSAPRATAAAGMMGLIAIGALAL